MILRVTYGKTSPTSNDDPEVKRIHQAMDNFLLATRPGAYLVDRMPWLRYVPGYGRQLKEWHQYELALFRDQLDRVRDKMVRSMLEGTLSLGSYHGCLCSSDFRRAEMLGRRLQRCCSST